MEVIIFILYLVVFSYLISSIPFFKQSGLAKWQLIALFCIKVVAGLCYAFFYKIPKYYVGSDTWRFYRLSIDETCWLLTNPLAFFRDIFAHGYAEQGGLFAGENSYWNDLKSNIPVKLMAIFNVVTNNSYYSNIILFNFLFFIGLVALFRFFDELFPQKKLLIVIGIFLLPSTLFWCSGIHKDGLILSAIGVIIYCFYNSLKSRFSLASIAAMVLSFALVFSLRNYLALALIPGLICWWICSKYSVSNKAVFTIVYSTGLVLFFTLRYLHPSLDFPAYIVRKQAEFSNLEGTSTVEMQSLKPTMFGFITFLPSAIDMAFFRPHITEATNLSYIPAAFENIFLIVVILTTIIFFRNNFKTSAPLLFCFFFSISILLLSGYTITLSGAIVRYRSIALPFLITPLLAMMDLHRLMRLVFKSTNQSQDKRAK